jgi:hypothetical protein
MNKVERNFIKKIINEHLTRYLRISYIFIRTLKRLWNIYIEKINENKRPRASHKPRGFICVCVVVPLRCETRGNLLGRIKSKELRIKD